MAFPYTIDAENRRVISEVAGPVTIDSIIETISSATSDPMFKPGFDVYSDHTQATQFLTPDMVKSTIKLLHSLSDRLAGSRWAVVTSADASYGMMRMLSVYAERVPLDLRVFRSAEEAEEWLDSPKLLPGGQAD